MSDNWKQWEGQIVVGEFPLLRYLGGSEHSAVFFTERHEGERVVEATIKLIPASPQAPQDEEVQLSRWRMAAEFSHPSLIQLYGMGRCEIAGVPLLYVVMEYAEENLASVLPSRALTQDEGRAMLDTILDVLRHLHAHGLVHGHVKPANVLAVGEQLKISSDRLRRIGEPVDGSGSQDAYEPPENARGIIPVPPKTAPAGDVWSLGVTLVETLTGSLPAAHRTMVPQSLPQPFLDIAGHCLILVPQGRWTVAQIRDRVEGRTPPSVALPSPVVAQQTSKPPARYGSAGYIAGGLALLLAVTLAGTSLLRHHSENRQIAADPAGGGQPAQPASAQAPNSREADLDEASAPSLPSADPISKAAVPAAAPSRPTPTATAAPAPAAPVAPAAAGEKPLEAGAVHGEVAQQVLPQVAASARETIQGKVKVRVRVNVDPSGTVKDAEFDSAGPSKYFSRLSMQAAQNWKFTPPRADGQAAASSWILQFEFTRDGVQAVPIEKTP